MSGAGGDDGPVVGAIEAGGTKFVVAVLADYIASPALGAAGIAEFIVRLIQFPWDAPRNHGGKIGDGRDFPTSTSWPPQRA